ncbi:MAG: hypothetical protein IJF75_00455, partial [Clostridia bacterium]|nr:hypothetical protein [Clostridia bacterium]
TYAFEMNGGSITINAVADYAPGAICAYESFLMNGGTITASATGENAYTIYLEGDFTMNGGSLKLSADCDGIILWEDSSIVVSGGTLEISTKEAGHAFIHVTESDGSVSIVPTVTGDYSMTASVNEDGSDATDFNESNLSSYKYVKVEPIHVHDHGTAWESDANEHWNECSCGDKANKAAHTDSDNNGKCDTCDYQMNAGSPNDSSNSSSSSSVENSSSTGSSNNSSSVENSSSASSGISPEQPESGLSTGAIVGIAIGSVAVVGFGGFAIFWFVIKKKTFAELIAIFKKK